jgi:hypothetical protein
MSASQLQAHLKTQEAQRIRDLIEKSKKLMPADFEKRKVVFHRSIDCFWGSFRVPKGQTKLETLLEVNIAIQFLHDFGFRTLVSVYGPDVWITRKEDHWCCQPFSWDNVAANELITWPEWKSWSQFILLRAFKPFELVRANDSTPALWIDAEEPYWVPELPNTVVYGDRAEALALGSLVYSADGKNHFPTTPDPAEIFIQQNIIRITGSRREMRAKRLLEGSGIIDPRLPAED